jgi:DNA mismatch endonuclease, patch repair protein
MPDNLKSEDRIKTMRAVKGKGTSLERRLFAMLAGMGISGWRKNAVDVIGKPDVVFDTHHIAIFVDGCFWHGCPQCKRKLPVTNRGYWKRKINRNIELAKSANAHLTRDGWVVMRIWEHEIRNSDALKDIDAKIRGMISKEPYECKRRPTDHHSNISTDTQ